jgi:hypothetical protein
MFPVTHPAYSLNLIESSDLEAAKTKINNLNDENDRLRHQMMELTEKLEASVREVTDLKQLKLAAMDMVPTLLKIIHCEY